ncbi:FmdB family transcriptional regulator [Nocardiopsis gilva YIM 90087]|uniref:FmdB family transcriptional regulator n=1 Tax=Nocardiopsis gilva YIM 90087 TaxID=1235441 RepID=A0A223S2U7_9ACTN|nr:FmdB family zinc ribbon protein [Nocardiopsis gilva]ASU82438.1 FmdB family transcriptional regulator [Nocardiopsis gilva YIM 90087]
MPTYQYACTECDHGMEVVQKFSDDSLTVCPQCEGRLRKVYSAVGIVFKGSGFYRTDSATSSDSSVMAGKSGNGQGASSESASSSSSSDGAASTSSSSSSSSSSASSSSGGSESTSSAPAAAAS